MKKNLMAISSALARGLDKAEPFIQVLIRVSGWSAIIFVTAIFFFIFREAAPILGKVNWGEFFFTNNWIPNPAEGNEPKYGALSMIYGTAAVTVCSLALAVPCGLGAAIYISEFAGPRVKETLKVLIELLAAIPSIVWGFIGLVVLAPILQDVTGAPVGVNLLNASLILALMSLPLIVSISEDALRAVPDSFREAGLALGASRWEIVYRVLFPAAKNGLLAACMLGVGRAVGETMAVLMASGNADKIPGSFANLGFLLQEVKTLTATIASEMGDTAYGDDHYRMLFVIGLLLLLITVTINVAS
ncbi:MAG: phosphate ABC transporter permease subunit PstC, partial [Verrucomicrobiota bacterium]